MRWYKRTCIFYACEIAFMIEHLSNDNEGNPDKKPHSSTHLLLILLEGIQRFGAGDWILRDL